jgi:DNA-binding NarL/FixJ family response regulator
VVFTHIEATLDALRFWSDDAENRMVATDERADAHVEVLDAMRVSLIRIESKLDALIGLGMTSDAHAETLSALPPARRQWSGEACPLSAREVEVLMYLGDGNVYKQIAHELSLTVSTVRTHLHHIYRKLGVVDRAQAVLVATRHGWI